MSVVAPPRRTSLPGSTLELLVLAGTATCCAGVDLASGALVRAHFPGPVTAAPEARFHSFDVVSADVASASAPEELFDPAAPEAVGMAAPFTVIGALRTRAAERYIRPLLHPEGRTILGFHGPAIPFWELHGDRPSMALVPARPVVAISADGRGLRCRFRWGNVFVDLPLLDRTYRPHLMAGLASGWRTLGGAALADVIGFTPQRLLVSLTHPKDGHCYKVVTALL